MKTFFACRRAGCELVCGARGISLMWRGLFVDTERNVCSLYVSRYMCLHLPMYTCVDSNSAPLSSREWPSSLSFLVYNAS